MGSLSHEDINRAFSRIKEKYQDNAALRKCVAELRKGIAKYVINCADNITVYIYMDEVLDEPITISYGKKENELLITINTKDGLDFAWIKQTFSKRILDGFDKVKQFLINILEELAVLLAKFALNLEYMHYCEFS